ncbi:MAG: hypothetical protein V3R70_11800 [Syntrophobacteria bacterium]
MHFTGWPLLAVVWRRSRIIVRVSPSGYQAARHAPGAKLLLPVPPEFEAGEVEEPAEGALPLTG